MKILHTSDWHIGRRFKGVDLHQWQQQALHWLIDYIEQESIELILVSGDVYDLPRPSAQAVQLLSDTINRITQLRVHGRPVEVVITPGNHDSALRLGFAADAFVPQLHMRWNVKDIVQPVVIEHDQEIVVVYAMPYLDPDAYRAQLSDQVQAYFRTFDEHSITDLPYGISVDDEGNVRIERSHDAMMNAAITLIAPDVLRQHARAAQLHKPIHVILMAHAFVSGSMPSDGERNIAIGGVDNVATDVFAHSGIDYLALGHLHRAQQVRIAAVSEHGAESESTSEATARSSRPYALARTWCAQHDIAVPETLCTPIARYSGSLLAYSFSESVVPPRMGNKKSVVVLETLNACDTAAETIDTGNMPGETSSIRVEHIEPVQSQQPAFAVVEGTVDEVLAAAASHQQHWVSARVHVNEYPRGLYDKLDYAYPYVLEKQVIMDSSSKQSVTPKLTAERTSAQDIEIITGFVQHMLGRPASAQEQEVLERALARASKHGGQ